MMCFCSLVGRAGGLASAPFIPWSTACVNSVWVRLFPAPSLQKQSACLNRVLSGHPLQCQSARKPGPSLARPAPSPPHKVPSRRTIAPSLGARSVCIFTWKCGSAALTKSEPWEREGRWTVAFLPPKTLRGTAAFCQQRTTTKLTCSQIQMQWLCPQKNRKSLQGLAEGRRLLSGQKPSCSDSASFP